MKSLVRRWHCSLLFTLFSIGTAADSSAQVVITEIMHSPGGNDALWEWVEVLNTTGQPVDLNGWVFDDEDDPGLATANITSAGGTRNTIVPAGGVAVLYPGDELEFMPERFNAAWGGSITLIGVDGLTVLTATDSIGLWPNLVSYQADAIPMAETSPRRNFANAVAAVNYSAGFPAAESGHSIAWTGTGSINSGASWAESQLGISGAFASVQTTSDGAQVNSTADRGNPGQLPGGSATSGLLITEVMFAPASPLATVGFSEADFEWVEVYNNTAAAINFAQQPHVFDDDDGNNLAAANLNSGALSPGQIGVLFNSARITIEDMQTIWGTEFNYIPVSQWPSLNNGSGGDTIAIWDSHSDYNSEPVVDSGRTHQNAISAVSYNTVAAQGWPTVNDESSIWLTALDGDPNVGTNWRRAGASGDSLSHPAEPIFDQVIDHVGDDIGSPGFAPGSVPVIAEGDYNDNAAVDGADYVAWRKFVGTDYSLPNDPDAGTTIDQDQYDTWVENFGAPTAGGAFGVAPVPEPATFILLAIGMMITQNCCRCAWNIRKRQS